MRNSEEYNNLLLKFAPRPITNDDEFDDTKTIINEIFNISLDRELTDAESDYLTVLGILIDDYQESVLSPLFEKDNEELNNDMEYDSDIKDITYFINFNK